jgi:tRNA threonylcarbamoyladenosine biosynthesis protein TsaE
MNLGTYTLRNLTSAATKLIAFADGVNVWCFEGEMGAGKTTLISKICKVLGVESAVSSPTYSLINEYEGIGGIKVFHFDFYRIKNLAEAEDLGLNEYFYSGHYCFIEWPSLIEPLLPDYYLQVKLGKIDEGQRKLEANVVAE